MMLWNRCVCALALAAVVLLSAGCGKTDSQGRLAVTGTVTFQGKPLDQGTILFTPLDPKAGAPAGATIKDGKFAIDAQKGLAPGKYRVGISSPEAGAKPAPEMPGESGPPAADRIPPDWRGETSKQEIVVEKGGKTDFPFDIK